jgi:dihydroxy-acid dehydratase
MGWDKTTLEKPLIGVANSFSELIPGHMHLRQVAEKVKEGIWSSGGVPAEFGTIGVCDGLAMGHPGMRFSLPSRELIADSIELVAKAHALDGLVLVTNCDKIVPGMVMAAARLNIPSVIISGGPMLAGQHHSRRMGLDTMFEAVGKVSSGQMTTAELDELECHACPGAGSCAGLFTANSMNCLCEALGLALPGNGTVPAVYGARLALAREAGRKAVEAVAKGLKPRDILSRQAFLNAVAVDMALGGSTNTALHLPAMAAEAGVELTLEDFDRISDAVPHLCSLAPSGPYFMEDLYSAGGVMTVCKVLDTLGALAGKALPQLRRPGRVEGKPRTRRQHRQESGGRSKHAGARRTEGRSRHAGDALADRLDRRDGLGQRGGPADRRSFLRSDPRGVDRTYHPGSSGRGTYRTDPGGRSDPNRHTG